MARARHPKRKSKRLYAMRNSMAGESPLAAHMLGVNFFAPITMTNAGSKRAQGSRV